MTLRSLAVAALVVLVGCTTTPPNPMTFNFDRPADVELLCVSVVADLNGNIDPNAVPVPLPLVECQTNDDGTFAIDLPSTNSGFVRRLFALVTQSDRGEVAVVNLHLLYQTGIVDNNSLIPGYTFIPVGAFPGALAVDPHGTVTYVANTGDTTVTVLDNTQLLRSQGQNLTDGSATGFITHRYVSRPTDVAVEPFACHVVLMTALPDTGQVVMTDVTQPRIPGPQIPLVLGSHVPPGADAGADGSTDFDASGDDSGADAAAEGGTSATAAPFHFAVSHSQANGDLETIYVSDLATPLVHVLHLVAPDGLDANGCAVNGTIELTEDTPLVADVPTEQIVVTPPVSAATYVSTLMPNADSSNGTPYVLDPQHEFVYASSRVDGTLLVLDTETRSEVLVNGLADHPDCDLTNPTRDLNHCPRIIRNRNLDPMTDLFRIPLISPVRSMAVVTRDAVSPGFENPDFPSSPGIPGRADTESIPSPQSSSKNPACILRVPFPEFDVATNTTAGTDNACGPSALGALPTPLMMRGIQVIVGTRTGNIQVVDVEDWQQDCAGRRIIPQAPPDQRHVLRAQAQFNAPAGSGTPVEGLVSAPTISVLNGGAVSSTATSEPLIVPAGTPAQTAGAQTMCTVDNNYCVQLPQIAAGQPNAGAIDALAVREDTWNLTYEGALPALSLTAGALEPDPVVPNSFHVSVPGALFCTNGTLPAVPGGYVGDHLVINHVSPCVTQVNVDAGPMVFPDANACGPDSGSMSCQDIFGTDPSPCNRDFIITAATQDSLTVSIPSTNYGTVTLFGDSTSGCSSTQFTSIDMYLSALAMCYPQAIPFVVRATGQWTVAGNLAGYQHNVVTAPGPDGGCVVDPTLFPSGRLTENTAFSNDAFTIQINTGIATLVSPDGTTTTMPQPSIRDMNYTFTLSSGYTPLSITAGVLPNAMIYTCPNRRLYVVDQARNALVEYDVTQLGSNTRTFN